ncbi:unnamed protein product [Macrosiphum euphorbiae]|uniref:DUF4806 domain-containing protein n=1 Tax=Macrosiphum euphorbiae TaxID=13131 RepID=A0AAV0Y028_9HEMI|nr:unnamed protein product [Macrosiphum euphorbiae]
MWSVIIFENDNSIEAVPSIWHRKNTCAWPKKNPKKFIEKQVFPNKTDFYFLRARKIGKDVGNYLDARNRAKRGENTSNLSDNVDENACLWDSTNSSSDDTDNGEVHYNMPNKPTEYDKGIEKISLGESSKRKLNFDESPPLINKYQSNNSQTNFNITSELIEFQSASIDNIVVVADKVNKINRTTLNTWYEIKSMNEKIEKLETNLFMISNNCVHVHTDDNTSFDSMNTFEVMMSVLPIVNEESLTTFEKNLLDYNFKKKVVCELSRLVRSTIQSTTRAILRYLFDDSFLQKYSYKGQKQKKSPLLLTDKKHNLKFNCSKN